MLKLARVRPGDKVYDLGSGDGRIVIMAAQKFGARGFGIELNADLCRLARSKIQALGLQDRVTIIEGSFFDQDLSSADAVTVYLEPSALAGVRKPLERFIHHGMRFVVSEGEIPGWTAASEDSVLDPETNRRFKLVVYQVSRPGDWVSIGEFGNRNRDNPRSPTLHTQQESH